MQWHRYDARRLKLGQPPSWLRAELAACCVRRPATALFRCRGLYSSMSGPSAFFLRHCVTSQRAPRVSQIVTQETGYACAARTHALAALSKGSATRTATCATLHGGRQNSNPRPEPVLMPTSSSSPLCAANSTASSAKKPICTPASHSLRESMHTGSACSYVSGALSKPHKQA